MKALLVVVAMTIFAVSAFAETYTWVDDQGTTNFADDLSKVPKKYRKKAKLLGEEEPAPAEVQEGQEKPAAQQKKAPLEGKEKEAGTPPAKSDMKAVYGMKDATTWKYEFAAARANLKAVEDQLVDARNRLKDTSHMSRSEYLSLQNTLKMLEQSVLGQRKKLDDLKQDAQKAGVPPELME